GLPHVGAQRRQLVDAGQPLDGGVGIGDAVDDLGLDVDRAHRDSVRIALRAGPQPLRQHPGPPGKAGALAHRPGLVDLEAVVHEVDYTRGWSHRLSNEQKWWRATAAAVATLSESTRPLIGMRTRWSLADSAASLRPSPSDPRISATRGS